MDEGIRVKPLPYKRRQQTFLLLLLVFVVSLPFCTSMRQGIVLVF